MAFAGRRDCGSRSRREWIPRIESGATVLLCDDRIKLVAKYDLALGHPGSNPSDVVIVDFKTGREYSEHAEEGCVPAFYIKLDPESNQTMSESTKGLLDPLANVESDDHPASEPYRLFKKLLERPITDLMVVRVKPRLWYRIDAR